MKRPIVEEATWRGHSHGSERKCDTTCWSRPVAEVAPPPECGSELLRKGLRCQRPVGHADAHMHFGTNGTTAWGFGL